MQLNSCLAPIFRRQNGAEGEIREPTMEDRRDLVLDHFRTLLERDDPKHALHKIRTFTNWYSRGWPGGKDLRRKIGPAGEDPRVLYGMVEEYFASAVEDRTEARRAA